MVAEPISALARLEPNVFSMSFSLDVASIP
jgi:hypothetical protein